MGVGGQRHAPGHFTSGKDPIPTERAPWPVWMGVENLAPNGIRSLDRPARSQSLYRLRFLAHNAKYESYSFRRNVQYFIYIQVEFNLPISLKTANLVGDAL
jgi:hypothetical protein